MNICTENYWLPIFIFHIISWTMPCNNHRLMHALFRIRTVIIPRDRYRPEGFRPRVDIGRGMITVLIWKKACINLFITYFNIELKRTKLTSHTDTKLMDMSDRYRLRDDNSSDMEKGIHWPIYKEAWYHVIRVLPRYLPMGWYCCGTSGVYAWATLTLLLITMW